jgi:hypothetical protein
MIQKHIFLSHFISVQAGTESLPREQSSHSHTSPQPAQRIVSISITEITTEKRLSESDRRGHAVNIHPFHTERPGRDIAVESLHHLENSLL